MPIVRYQRHQTISGTNPVALADVNSAGNVAATIGQSVETLAKRYQEIKKQNDEITKVNKINEYDTEVTNWLIDMQETKTGEKSYDLQKEYTDWHTNKVNNLTKDISDPQVKTAINNHFTDMSNHIKLKVSSFQVGQKKVVVDTAKQNALDISLKGVTTGSVSPYEAINLYKNKIGMLKASKAISSDEEADKITKEGVSQIGETYLGRMINDNPSGALEQIKSDMWTDIIKPEAIVKLKDTAAKMEKSKGIQDEKDKIEKELKYSEDIENTLLKSFQKGALTWKQIMDATTPPDFNQWSSQAKNRHNSMIEKYTAIKKSEEERDKKANKEALKPENNALFNELYMRAETDWGDDNIPVEKKVTNSLFDYHARTGEITPGMVGKLKTVLKKSQQTADPHRQEMTKIGHAQIKNAWENNVFGDKDSIAADIVRGNLIQSMNKWVDQNPDKDPLEYTKKLLAPYGISKWKEAMNFATMGLIQKPVFTESTETPSLDVIKTREEELLQGKTSKTVAPVVGAKQAPDGKWYIPDPKRKGKYLRVD